MKRKPPMNFGKMKMKGKGKLEKVEEAPEIRQPRPETVLLIPSLDQRQSLCYVLSSSVLPGSGPFSRESGGEEKETAREKKDPRKEQN